MNIVHKATLRTQNLSFGSQSRHIHAGSSAHDRQLTLDNIESHAFRIVELALHVVVMVKDLMHIQNTKGILKFCADVVKKNNYPIQLHRRRTQLDAQVGDFVVANGKLAQVIKVKISKGYRYKSFRVHYLIKPPLPGVTEEEMPGDWIRVIYKRESLVEQTLAAIMKLNPNAKPTSREINQKLKDGIIEGWDNGLKEYVLGRREEGQSKLDAYQKLMEERYARATNPSRLMVEHTE